MDFDKIIAGVKTLIEGICDDPTKDEFADTPRRVADMWRKFLQPQLNSDEGILEKTFSVKNYESFVIVKDIQFSSFCEHHLLPFFGKISIAYVPKNNLVVGISKLARIVDKYSKQLQLQERLTQEILDAIMSHTQNDGVLVIVSAQHMCMTARGIMQPSSKTITRAIAGKFLIEKNLIIEAQQLVFGTDE